MGEQLTIVLIEGKLRCLFELTNTLEVVSVDGFNANVSLEECQILISLAESRQVGNPASQPALEDAFHQASMSAGVATAFQKIGGNKHELVLEGLCHEMLISADFEPRDPAR